MKNKIFPSDCVRLKKLKKHLSHSKSLKLRLKRKKLKTKLRKKAREDTSFIKVEDNPMLRDLSKICKNGRLKGKDTNQSFYKFKAPIIFDIFSDPEAVLKSLGKLQGALSDKKVKKVFFSQSNVKKTSLGSEFLLGRLATEYQDYRAEIDSPIDYEGKLPRDKRAFELTKHIGILSEVMSPSHQSAKFAVTNGSVHVYKVDNKLNEVASVSSEDKKTTTATDCVSHLEKCLNEQQLSLKVQAANKIRFCIGEILDNANDHCNRTAPVWFVRSFLNTSSKRGRFFELMVLNLGDTIAETFEELPEESKAKKLAMKYVNKHLEKESKCNLLTVSALQGNTSSKKDADPTRGQGTVNLIETFEAIHRSYVDLRVRSGDNSVAQMNLISGSTVVRFDGTYHSQTKVNEKGEESVTIAFNKESSLELPPDSRFVYSMDGVHFPGLMINIRIPLQGSTTPLHGIEDKYDK
ncbi:hypothetical protein RQY88_001051 [Vibrio vulnificus]|uniref:hypothetical protein n=1 Tax=Vibrio vulnificus TaxID=672 RepID=UPI000B4CAA67|nr:hypothetical protein [Vibrio vulnificus]ASC57311.1 hypothetical protein FORC37_1617 [Vibrio vulnificus]EGQ9279871.1 hypothetical protein [Vibrio vulnificus]EHU9453534.1 hypothetical protein [Vibrio vulnificus]EJO2017429.1 hypothetical protein [Vibrio vulnificus]EKD8801784.1 hypothetical protein [Vibrio vulnificus]